MAFMDEKSLKKHISSKKFNNIYVIFGDEKYLCKFYTNELAEAVAGKDPCEFAFHQFSSETDIQDIADAVGMVPFMTEYNCVLVKDYDINKLSKEQYDSLIAVLKSVPDTTVLIFSFTTIDPVIVEKDDDEKKRSKFKPFCGVVEKMGMGCVAEINMRSATSLEHQLAKWADKFGKKLSLPVASKLIYYCGTDLSTLKMELDKVCAFAQDREEITVDMVEATVIKKLEVKVFDMVDSVIYGNTDKAYTQLRQLFAMREDPRSIVFALSFVYIDLYRAKVTVQSGSTIKETAKFFNCQQREWALNKAVKKSKDLSVYALRESLNLIIELNGKLNSFTVNEEAAVEKLIADLILVAIRERNNV